MADIKKALDLAGLASYDSLIKQWVRQNTTTAVNEAVKISTVKAGNSVLVPENKVITLAEVARTGSYNSLSDKPDLNFTLEDIEGALVETSTSDHLITLSVNADGTLDQESVETDYEGLSIDAWPDDETYNSLSIFSWPIDFAIGDFDKKILSVTYDGTVYSGHPIKINPYAGSEAYIFGFLDEDEISPEDPEYEAYMATGFADFPFKMQWLASPAESEDEKNTLTLWWAWFPNDAKHTFNFAITDTIKQINPDYLLDYLTEHQDISGKADIKDLAKVATTGSYKDLKQVPVDYTISTTSLNDSVVQFAYRSADIDRYDYHGGGGDPWEVVESEFYLVPNYYYNVTFDNVLYEGLVSRSAAIVNPESSSLNFVGLGNRALSPIENFFKISEEESNLPFYIITSPSGPSLFLHTLTSGEHTITVQATGEKVETPSHFLSVGMYTAGATSMEELQAMMEGGTYPTDLSTEFSIGTSYPIKIGEIEGEFEAKSCFIPALTDASLIYFGNSDLIQEIAQSYGNATATFTEESTTDLPIAALILPVPGQTGFYVFAATTQQVEIIPEFTELLNAPGGLLDIQICSPSVYADMQILQGQSYGVEGLDDLNPFTTATFMSLNSDSEEPDLEEHTKTLTTYALGKQDICIGQVRDQTWRSLYTRDNIRYYRDWNGPIVFDNKTYAINIYTWEMPDGVTAYYGNPTFSEEALTAYNSYKAVNGDYDPEEDQDIKACPFLIKIQDIGHTGKNNTRLYDLTYYTQYAGIHTFQRGSSESIFTTDYPIKYFKKDGSPFNYEYYPENFNYVPTDWYRVLDDDLKLTAGQRLTVTFRDTEYNLLVKESDKGFTYAGNPAFIPEIFHNEALPLDADIPFCICSHHKASGNSWPQSETQSRFTTRVYFDPALIIEAQNFKLSSEAYIISQELPFEVIEPILPQVDWSETDETSKAFIQNKTHYDTRQGSYILKKHAIYFVNISSAPGIPFNYLPGKLWDINVSLSDGSTLVFSKTISQKPLEPWENNDEVFNCTDDITVWVNVQTTTDETEYLGYARKYSSINIAVPLELLPVEYQDKVNSLTGEISITEVNNPTPDIDVAALHYSDTLPKIYNASHRSCTIDGVSATSCVLSKGYIHQGAKDLPAYNLKNSIDDKFTYTVILNGKKYLVHRAAAGLNGSTYYCLGNTAYMMVQKYSRNWNTPSVTAYGDTDLKFAIGIYIRRHPDNSFWLEIADIYYDYTMKSEFVDNFKSLEIYAGELKELDHKYIPAALTISQADIGFTTGEQVYNYVNNYVASALANIEGVMHFKGTIGASAEIPVTADPGDVYIISTAYVVYQNEALEPGDMMVYVDSNTGWKVVQANLTVPTAITSGEINEVLGITNP